MLRPLRFQNLQFELLGVVAVNVFGLRVMSLTVNTHTSCIRPWPWSLKPHPGDQAGQKGWLPSLGSLGVGSSAKLSRLPVRRPDHLPSHCPAGPGGRFAPYGQLLAMCSLGHSRALTCCGPLSPAQGHVCQSSETLGWFRESSLPGFGGFCVQTYA